MRLTRSASISIHGGAVREMAVSVLARMRDDESKLLCQMKRMIKERKTFATQALCTEIDGWMPLHACVLHASKKLLKVFLSSGVDVNIPMGQPEGLPRGCTPLHIACWRGDSDITKFLLSHGADVDAVDGSGRTPVMYAVKRRHRHIVRLLEDKGANMAAVQLPVIWNECTTPTASPMKFCFF
ncbi:ankyrin repeat and SAM domain-containing protein 3-like [Mya arenaria]|uniref:ankyrin repeat and SAM domain-containing protein 3-like n=1 Tax=Mya arenaria TaxID=6604 RepID=UPI0022E04534|nr:ankyrin repeat and SAM domain-containing protein 3-like [Mya arenaria]XP_052763895.1 ankyrin repeat and SAM domain-containing protein 3-like [Mya arenaria]XP_052763897.1 ankyrin repeat and SAM domain-containing protein 3-like [Mya arenaria]XP_052763898.1 ankyrin repeat and SAM domain-containing protein 3-like [Mya arenaria]